MVSRYVSIALVLLAAMQVAPGQSKVFDAQRTPAFDAARRLDGPTVAFFVMGNWGTGQQAQRDVAEGLFKKHAADPVDAVLTTGNNILPDGVKSTDDPLWDIRFESVYTASSLSVPFYATLGSADHTTAPDAQIAYKGKRLRRGVMQWNMPGRYWSKVFASADGSLTIRITGLDTHTLVSGDKEEKKAQLGWLDSVLALNDADWNIAIGHHAVYSNGQRGNTLSMIMQAKPLFEKHGVDAYFSGNDEDLQLLQPVNGVQYIISGAGGEARSVWWRENTAFAAASPGFVWMQCNADAMLLQFLSADATVLYAFSVFKH